MKRIITIGFGSSRNDYEFETEFLGNAFQVKRIGTDGDIDRVGDLLLAWDGKADALGLEGLYYPSPGAPREVVDKQVKKLARLQSLIKSPLTTGARMRRVGQEWSLRHIQQKFSHFFTNARVFFFAGNHHFAMAQVMAEFTSNLTFADPLTRYQLPFCLHSLRELEWFARTASGLTRWVPGKSLLRLAAGLDAVSAWRLKRLIRDQHVLVLPHDGFYGYLAGLGVVDLCGKTVITSTAYDDRVSLLRDRGVKVIIDTTPKILQEVVDVSALEAMIIAALETPGHRIENDDILTVIAEKRLDPRVIYPSGQPRRVTRFAFVIHPLSREDLKKEKAIGLLSRAVPPAAMKRLEKTAAHARPYVYSKVTGIKSPTGVEAEGWLIALGATPEEMLARDPEFTYQRVRQAAELARKLGAQIIGLGGFLPLLGDGGITLAKTIDMPTTTGNHCRASGALWAVADTARRMGLVEVTDDRKLMAKAMVVGAAGTVGTVCGHLLAKAFKEIHLIDGNTARLLEIKEGIQEETPEADLHVATRPEKDLGQMDAIVLAGPDPALDLMKVKSGAIVTDVLRPIAFNADEMARRPDVLFIESGEYTLPGNPEFEDIGLPPQMVHAPLAETIILALEERFEPFSIGAQIAWDKVREIYRLGLKHGVKLGSISGVSGPLAAIDMTRVTDLVRREPWEPAASGAKPRAHRPEVPAPPH